jgi:hypothetical protein
MQPLSPPSNLIKPYLRSLYRQWVLGVSGGAATIFAAVAGLAEAYAEALLLAAVALGVFCVASYRAWAVEKEKVIALEERLRPKLKCSVPHDDPGCVRPDTLLDAVATSQDGSTRPLKIKATYFRVRVETDGAHHVSGCHGRLLSAKFYDKTVISGENIDLPFALSNEDAFAKTVYESVPEYLDLIAVPEGSQPIIATKGFIKPSSIGDGIFKQLGLYVLHVVVLTPEGEPAHTKVLFNWTGDPRTSTMSK